MESVIYSYRHTDSFVPPDITAFHQIEEYWEEFVESQDRFVCWQIRDQVSIESTCRNYNLLVHEEARLTARRQKAFSENPWLLRHVSANLGSDWRRYYADPRPIRWFCRISAKALSVGLF